MTVPQLPETMGDDERVDGRVRVLAVVDRYPPWINAGAEWMLHSILRRLVENGHECMVSTALPDGTVSPVDVDGVQVYGYDDADNLASVADVLVGHLLWTREVIDIAVRHRLPLMYLMHNDRQIAHWNLAAPNATVMVWNSEWVAAKCGPGWRGPSFVCRPPVFVDDYKVDDRSASREFVTLVNPIPEKGSMMFYEMARRLHRTKFLAVTGAYGHQHRPPYFVDNVTMIPPTADMRADVYSRTRVLLVPSTYESWGRVAVEGMAAGCPVLASPTPGLRESCGNAVQYADPEYSDDANVARWVQMVDGLADPNEWRRWSTRGRKRARALEAVTDGDLVEFDGWLRRVATLAPDRVGT